MIPRWLKRLFCIEWPSPRCVSMLDGKPVVLSRSFVQGAIAVSLECDARWPLFSWNLPSGLTCTLQNETGQPLPHAVRPQPAGTGRRLHLHVDLSVEGLAGTSTISLQVFVPGCPAPLAIFSFAALEAEQVVQSLQPGKFTVAACHGQLHSTGARLHDQVERLEFDLDLSVPDCEHRALLEQLGNPLRLQLADAEGREVLRSETAFRFAGERLRWNDALPVAAAWHGKPGHYALTLATGHSTLATRDYEVTDYTERGNQVRRQMEREAMVQVLEFSCRNHRARVLPLAVVAEDYVSLDASAVLELAPADELFPQGEHRLRLVLSSAASGGEVLSQPCELTLTPGTNELRAHLQLGPDIFSAGPGQYSLRLHLGERLLGEQEFAHKLRREIQREKAAAIFLSLELSDLRLFSRRDGRRVETNEVWETDPEIIPAFAVTGQGFDDDAPKLRWRLRVQVRRADGGVVRELDRHLHAGPGRNQYAKVAIPLRSDTGSRLAPGRYELLLLKRDTIVLAAPFRILATEEVADRLRRDILDSVRIEDLRVRVHAGTQRYESELVADSSDYLGVQFTVTATGFHELVPEVPVTLVLVLEHEHAEQPILEQTICLSPEQMPVRNLLVRVRGGSLAGAPGPCRLAVLVDGQARATHDFTIVSAETILEQVRITRLAFQGISSTERGSSDAVTLVYQPERLIAPAFVVVTGMLAPNLLIPVEVLLQSEAGVLAAAQMDIPLQELEGAITSQPVNLRSLGSERSLTRSPLTLVVCVGGASMAALVLRLVASTGVVNFEGQLATDAAQINVDEQACRGTLARLGI